jgi:hypothetical protein
VNTGTRPSLLFLLACLASCDSPTGLAPLSSPPTDLEAARAYWESHDLERYRFDTQRLCFCHGLMLEPVRISVEDGAITSVLSRDDWRPLPLPGEEGGVTWYTIEDLFDWIEEAMAMGQYLSVEYDPRGYPADLTIGTMVNDAGTHYLVGNVRRID